MHKKPYAQSSRLSRYLVRSLAVGGIATMGLISACGGGDVSFNDGSTVAPTATATAVASATPTGSATPTASPTTTATPTVTPTSIPTGPPSTTAVVSLFAGEAGEMGGVPRFSLPSSIANDGAGNLIVAQNNDHLLRKVDLSTAEVTHYAGAYSQSDSTDGTLSEARFRNPEHMVADNTGNLFVVDGSNATIRQINLATSMVTTLVGTPLVRGDKDGIGEAAKLMNPVGIAFDPLSGDLFVSAQHTIRRINIATREVTTFAGKYNVSGDTDATGTSARFSGPEGIAADGNGNLYVADKFNRKIRKIVIATGEVSTLAVGFSSPQGITFDAVSGHLFVADAGSHTIRKIVIATGQVNTVAGKAGVVGSANGSGLVARFNEPIDITSAGGNLYVADRVNHTIRKITTP